jgi:hypothetical protein
MSTLLTRISIDLQPESEHDELSYANLTYEYAEQMLSRSS